MGLEIVQLFIQAGLDSAKEMRQEICNIRYGKLGEILFDFRSQTYSTAEPVDLLPTMYPQSQASKSWALKQLLSKNATVV